MKKALSAILAGVIILSAMAGCGGNNNAPSATNVPAATNAATVTKAPDAVASATEASDIVDGKFTETRKITVEIYDRSTEGAAPVDDNWITEYIKAGMLEKHNVEVTYVPVPRWDEVPVMNNLLAAGDAPDVCVTYSFPTIQTYANMGGILDMNPIFEAYPEYMQNLVNLVGPDFITYDQDPATGTIWAIEAHQFNLAGQKTMIREDWLAKLGLPEPKTIAQFADTLRAFKENAETLLGAEASSIIPLLVTYDVGWNNIDLADAMLPADMTDKDQFVYGFDDRRLLYPGYKESVRYLNQWYNEGLIWQDFALYGSGDETSTNLIKSGYVGAHTQNIDVAYRDGENGWQQTLQRLVSPDAAYITVATFENEAGQYRKYWGMPVDRKVFFPGTNDEPLASLMYLDFISTQEHLQFIQMGVEGEHHEVMPDGALKMLSVDGARKMQPANNIDYTITCNGIHLGVPTYDIDLTNRSLQFNYAGIDARYIQRAFDLSEYTISYRKNAKVGEIKAEEGMGTVLQEKRDNMLAQAVTAPAASFDAIYDAGMADYLNSGGQAIIDERIAAWEAVYGDAVNID